MAVKLQANYSKKIGLPQYSSHSFMASVEVELTDLSQVESECQRLYSMLQQAVDSELQQVGYLPAETPQTSSTTRRSHERERNPSNHQNHHPKHWSCTEGQRTFITKLIDEHELDEAQIEALSRQMFNVAMPQLNKMQASQFIEELLSKVGKPREQRWSSPDNRSNNSNGNHSRRPANSNNNQRMEAVA